MNFLILAVLVAAGFGLASILKSTKEQAFQDGLALAEKRRLLVEQKAREAKPLLAQCDQGLLYLILDIFSGRIKSRHRLPQPLYHGTTYLMHPSLIDWVCEIVAKEMALKTLPESISDNPWLLYEQVGPIASRTREYMDDARQRIEEALLESEDEAIKLLCDACQPFLELADADLKLKRDHVFAETSRICQVLVESGFVTIEEQLIQKWERLIDGVPMRDIEVHYDPEHKGQTLVTFQIMRPKLGPHRYEPYEVARSSKPERIVS
ncbi:MAG: hypothetical protein R3C17_21475 [Planctomycetaceae bacterium]